MAKTKEDWNIFLEKKWVALISLYVEKETYLFLDCFHSLYSNNYVQKFRFLDKDSIFLGYKIKLSCKVLLNFNLKINHTICNLL